jgi:hypothetical protein
MQVWDLRSGTQLYQLKVHGGSLGAPVVAVAQLEGRPVAITGGGVYGDSIVRVWDLGATVKTLVPTLQNLVVVNTPLGLVVLRLNSLSTSDGHLISDDRPSSCPVGTEQANIRSATAVEG